MDKVSYVIVFPAPLVADERRDKQGVGYPVTFQTVAREHGLSFVKCEHDTAHSDCAGNLMVEFHGKVIDSLGSRQPEQVEAAFKAAIEKFAEHPEIVNSENVQSYLKATGESGVGCRLFVRLIA